ncbi:MAG: hypothetical protein RJA25_225 [Bacteroidota bacterium]|jgi:FkbM family methyltransferase
MNTFEKALRNKINASLYNNYGIENYDEDRFGTYKGDKKNISIEIKTLIKRILHYKDSSQKSYLSQSNFFIQKYGEELQQLYNILNENDKKLIVDIIAYRILGYTKVKLPSNNKEYRDAITLVHALTNSKDTYDPHFLHFILEKINLQPIGFDIQLYFTPKSVATDFILEQYAYKKNKNNLIQAEAGDVVLDLGACWGDTALYFANKVGEKGKVYSFEFIPENIKLFHINLSFNPPLQSRIELISFPISDVSNKKIYYKDNGPGSTVLYEPFDEQTGVATTLTIDDFVRNNSIAKIDFIKMDIEGAELSALNGAIETIKKFKPKLAIAIYHSLNDFVNIPLWIKNLNLDYDIFIDHFTIHSEETICFAIPKK